MRIRSLPCARSAIWREIRPIDLSTLGSELGATAAIAVSAETGAGVQRLLMTIGAVIDGTVGLPELDAPVLTQERHRHAVARALAELEAFRDAWRDEKLPATIAAVHLHAAGDALRDLIGGDRRRGRARRGLPALLRREMTRCVTRRYGLLP